VPSASPQPPEPTATTTYDQPDDPADEDRIRGFHVDQATGEVTAVAGGEVRQAIPMGDLTADSGAVAVAMTLDGEETWWYVDWDTNGGGSSHEPAKTDEPFAEWAERMHEMQQTPFDPDDVDDPMDLVVTDRFGVPEIQPGVEVLQRIDNPFDLQAPYTSVALDLRKGDQHMLMVLTPNGGSFGVPGQDTLQGLIADLRAMGPSMSVAGPMPPLWDISPGDGMPVLRSGVQTVRKVDNPLGVAAPRRSVAYVVRFEGKTWWALWELGPSGLDAAQSIRVAFDGYGSIDAWLADQKSRATW
jgi:hypothetical protein